jgi:RNA polymerase sigma factor (sigma-70 family)
MTPQVALTKAQEKLICKRIRAGDNAALHELVAHHIGYALRVAKKLAKGAFDSAELRSSAIAGLYDAASKWDSAKGRFTSYSSFAVRRKVFEMWGMQLAVKISCKSYNKMRKAGKGFHFIPRESNQFDAPSRRGVGDHDEAWSSGSRGYTDLSDDAEFFKDNFTGFDSTAQNESMAQLADALETLKPRELKVITDRYVHGLSFVDMGKKWTPKPVSGEWMRVVHDEALAALRKIMAGDKKTT